MPDRRFRDMRLTEEEVRLRVSNYLWDKNPKRFNCGLLDRAKRLLPLWREWGLEELINKSFEAGWDEGSVHDLPPFIDLRGK